MISSYFWGGGLWDGIREPAQRIETVLAMFEFFSWILGICNIIISMLCNLHLHFSFDNIFHNENK